MKIRNSVILSTIILSLIALGVSQGMAQALSGSITNRYNTLPNLLWDLSEVSDWQTVEMEFNEAEDKSSVKVEFDAPWAQDGKGRFAGTDSSTTVTVSERWTEDDGRIVDNVFSFPASCTIKGFITSSKGIARVTFSAKVAGRAVMEEGDRERTISGATATTCVINPASGRISGRYSQKAAAQGYGGKSTTETFDDAIPSSLGDGSWTLILNPVAEAANKYGGTATVTLGTGQVYSFTIKGTYTPNRSESKLTLAGIDTALGSKLQLKLAGTEIKFISGKVSGQAIKVP